MYSIGYILSPATYKILSLDISEVCSGKDLDKIFLEMFNLGGT